MNKKFTILTAVLLLLTMIHLPGRAVGQTEVTDVINNSATSSNLGSISNTSWATDFDLTGSSGAVYRIHSMGTKNTTNALQWNSSGFMNMTSTRTGYKLKSVTIVTTTNKNISLYASNTAYGISVPSGTALATIAATSSGATYTFQDKYTYLALKGTASSTSITSITIVWEDQSVVSFTPGTGTYAGTINVSLSAQEGAEIYYTTDGSTPTSGSNAYSDPIEVSSDITLKAIAIKGGQSSAVTSASYTFLTPFTSMEAIYNEAYTNQSSHLVGITFDNWVVSGTTATKAYVTDGKRGFEVTDSAIDFSAGDVLSGSTTCNLSYNATYGYASITGLKSSNYGLSVDSGGTVNAVTAILDTLTGKNVGSVVKITDIVCKKYNSNNFIKDNEDYAQITNSVNPYASSYTWVENKSYDVTGIFWLTYGQNYDASHQTYNRINPRSADDILPGDQAILPFDWSGGGKDALQALQGVTTSSLSSDYDNSYAPYLVKFANTGNYILVRTDSQPDVVTIGVKKIGGGGNSTITVQGSSDGVAFDDGEVLTIEGASNAIVNLTSTRSFGEDVRYVKLLFTKSSNVGVGPISITKNAPTITVSESSISGFNYINGNGPSESQNFTVSGIHLADNLVVTASSNYEVCKTVDGTYGSSVSYEPTSGSVATSTVYVRLKAGLSAGSYATDDDKITVSSTGADSETVSLSGSVTPTYTLTTVVYPAGSGTVTLGTASLVAGSTTTATASANAGYKFTGWSISGTGASLSSTSTNPTTVTMGTAAATITATFEAVTTHPVHWSVNGTIVKTDNVEEGTAITFAAPTSGVPEGFVFKGWVVAANQIPTYTNTDPQANYVTSANCTDEITYYAVMALVGSSSTETATLTKDNTTWNSYADKTFTDDKGNIWTANCTGVNQSSTYYFGLKAETSSYFKSPDFGGNITAISVNARNGSSNDRYFYIKSTQTGTSGDLGNILVTAGASGENINATLGSTSFSSFYLGASGALQFHSIAVTYNVITYSNFCTTINTFSTAGNWNVGTNWSWGSVPTTEPSVSIGAACTIPNGTVANVNNIIIADGGSLIIEDGGQLITSNAVAATVKKEIVGFGSVNTVQTGWYTIASPVTTSITPSSDMLQETYDLYYYDEANDKWYNYRPNNEHSGFNIEPNKGYLYANSGNTTLSFSGTMRASNASVSMPLSYASSDENLKGLNLVGNPYTCELNSETNIMLGTVNFSAYYIADGTVNAQGKNLIACEISERNIKPCEGFIVQATAADQNLVFNGRGRSEQNGYLRITAGNNDFTDRAYVHFGNANTLRKMTISDNTAQVYVMQDNKDYAAATIEEAQGEMPVSFRANENGQYTLTVNAENVEMNYLHLIDNMTGADTDLLSNPSYTFNAKTTDYESRFRLVFASATMNEDSDNETFAFFSNDQLVIINEGQATLQVIDVNGRILRNETINGSTNVSMSNTPGVYMLRLINGSDVKVQKIVVK